jgi:hypothetical protein
MEKLPIFRFIVGEDDEAQLEAVAFVDTPAIEMNWQAFNSNQYKFKAEVEKRIISGPLMVADLPIYRRTKEEGEYYGVFQKEDIYNLRNKFFKQGKSNLVNEMHNSNKMIDGVYMIESFLIDEQRGVLAPKGYTLTDGSWFGSYKIDNDEIWNDFIKSGEFKGFSVEGLFKTVKIDEKPQNIIEDIINIVKNVFGGPGSGRTPEGGNNSDSEQGGQIPKTSPISDEQARMARVAGASEANPPSNADELNKLGEEKGLIPSYSDPLVNYYSQATTQDERVNETIAMLEKIGIPKSEINSSTSQTSAGQSDYIRVQGADGERIKIRISDHSVSNATRLSEETHIANFNMGRKLYEIEQKVFPKRFDELKKIKVKTPNGIIEKPLLARKKI